MRTKQLIVLLAAIVALTQTASSSKSHAAAKPNIVIIFIDDLGSGPGHDLVIEGTPEAVVSFVRVIKVP